MRGRGFQVFRTVQFKLIVIYVLMILFAMQLIGAYFVKTLETTFTNNFTNSMKSEADLLAQQYLGDYITAMPESRPEESRKTRADLDSFVSNWYGIINAEIQIIDANGVVLSTSQTDSKAIVGQKNTQQVVNLALQNIKDKETERTITDVDGKRKKVMARPVLQNGKVVGAVYLVKSMEDMYGTLSRINQIFLTGTIIALAMTAALGVVLSSTITAPIKEITKQATSVAEGRFDQQVKVYGQDEIGQLSHAFNHMTDRLREALSVNEEEKEKLSSILLNMNDGVIAADIRNRVILMNRRAKQMLMAKEEDTVGLNVFDVLGIPHELRAASRMEHDRSILIGIPSPDDEEEELQVRVSFTPIHNRERGISGTIVVLQDVTEQEKLDHARREFVANVSHELRTPLTTIKSYLEALEDGALEDPALAKRFIGVTRNETERMIRLVTDLLHLSRLDSKQAAMKMEWTKISDMLEEVMDRFSFQLRQRKIGISLQMDSAVGAVKMDRDQIDQVLDNLVSNAIKYTGDGGRIILSALRPSDDQVEISVEDNGIGIPKKDLDRIFDRFYRVDKARSRNMGGTGLGLSIAREMVKAHGGTVRLESELNHGTKVTFTLPSRTDESEVL